MVMECVILLYRAFKGHGDPAFRLTSDTEIIIAGEIMDAFRDVELRPIGVNRIGPYVPVNGGPVGGA